MEDTTTTAKVEDQASGDLQEVATVGGVAVDDTGYAIPADESQPETPTEAADVQTEETQPSPEAVEPVKDDLTKWAESKGIDPSDPQAALRSAREAEQRMHQATTEAAAAKKQAEVQQLVDSPAYQPLYSDPNTDLGARLARLETDNRVATFYAQNPEARSLDVEMSEIAKADPVLAAYIQRTGNIQTLYTIAKANQAQNDVTKAEERGAQKAKAELAKSSKAAMPTSAATQSSNSSRLTMDKIDAMPFEEYQSRAPEIDVWLAAGGR